MSSQLASKRCSAYDQNPDVWLRRFGILLHLRECVTTEVRSQFRRLRAAVLGMAHLLERWRKVRDHDDVIVRSCSPDLLETRQ